jgi:hypothetical protein
MKSDILYLKQVAFAVHFPLAGTAGGDGGCAPFLANA